MEQLQGFFYNQATGLIGKKVSETRGNGRYKFVNVRCVVNENTITHLNTWANDADVVPAETVPHLRKIGVTKQEINEELEYRYGTDFSDR